MEEIQPDINQEERPAAVLEKTPPLRKWLIGIAVGALVGVGALLIHSGGKKEYKPAAKAKKERKRENRIKKDVVNSHELVDLGLPSGLKWSTYNVGAASPTEFGNYYAWGETEPKEEYVDINSLTHRKELSFLQKEGIVDDEGILTPEHDVATVVWGEPWRMPTDEEFEELLDECSWEFTPYNGVNGYMVTGPNGQTVFFVAAGFKQDDTPGYVGEYGDYWSSSIVPELIGASCSLGYGPTSVGRRRYARFVGRTIRAVVD